MPTAAGVPTIRFSRSSWGTSRSVTGEGSSCGVVRCDSPVAGSAWTPKAPASSSSSHGLGRRGAGHRENSVWRSPTPGVGATSSLLTSSPPSRSGGWVRGWAPRMEPTHSLLRAPYDAPGGSQPSNLVSAQLVRGPGEGAYRLEQFPVRAGGQLGLDDVEQLLPPCPRLGGPGLGEDRRLAARGWPGCSSAPRTARRSWVAGIRTLLPMHPVQMSLHCVQATLQPAVAGQPRERLADGAFGD